MGQLPTISVIIPTYNGAKFLVETLGSVAKQDYPPFEVLVIDGGSSDPTRQVVEAYGPLVTTFISEPDKGQLDAVRKGLERATGDVFYWLNADDIVMPGAFRAVAHAFAADPDVGIVFSDDYAFSLETRAFVAGATVSNVTFEDRFLFYRHLYSECVFWKRELTQKVYPIDTSLRVATDVSLTLPMHHNTKTRWLRQKLGAFRTVAGQLSEKYKDRTEAELTLIKQRLREKLGITPQQYAQMQARHRLSFFLRNKLYTKAFSAFRFLGRKLSADYRRKKLARFFFDEWLVPPPQVRERLKGIL